MNFGSQRRELPDGELLEQSCFEESLRDGGLTAETLVYVDSIAEEKKQWASHLGHPNQSEPHLDSTMKVQAIHDQHVREHRRHRLKYDVLTILRLPAQSWQPGRQLSRRPHRVAPRYPRCSVGITGQGTLLGVRVSAEEGSVTVVLRRRTLNPGRVLDSVRESSASRGALGATFADCELQGQQVGRTSRRPPN